MPTIRRSNIAAGTSNALDGLFSQDLPEAGALVTLYASTAVAGGLVSYAVGEKRYVVDASCNVEIVADAVDSGRDLIMDREVIPAPGGKQFLSVDAQVVNYLLIIEELPTG